MRAVVIALTLVPAVAWAQTAPLPPAPAAPPAVVVAPPAVVSAPPAVVVAPVAVAPAPADPSECTVTTTVRCTGAAAPYAVPAAQPQTVVVPAPPSPPAAPVAPAPAAVILDARQLGNGWRLVQSPDGGLWRERKISSDSPAVWGTGMAFWLGGYAIGVIAGMEEGNANLLAWWPIIGAFINSSFNSGTAQALWAVDGIAQAGGFVTFLVGLAAGPDKLERHPLAVTPASFVGGGSGVALSGRF